MKFRLTPSGAEPGMPVGPAVGIRRWYGRNVLLLAAVGIAVLPLAWRGPSCGMDFDFHLQSWLEVVAHWRAGVVYPHWAASANFGAGEPRFIFYPPLSWLLGGLLGALLPWTWTGFAYTALSLLGAAWSFRAMARAWMSEESASLAACVYALTPYLMFVAYERAAQAELLAAVWMPLLVLYALRPARSVVPLALMVAALWLTNAPAAVMGMYFLAVMALIAASQEKRGEPIRRAAAGAALGLGLAAFWLLPAFYEERWVEIWRAIGPLMRVEDSFLFGFVDVARLPANLQFDGAFHNHVLGLVSCIAAALLAATALAAALTWRKRRIGLWVPLVVTGTVIAILQFRWSDGLWRVVPEMRFLQFPWRWLLVLGLVLAVLVGLAIGEWSRRTRALVIVVFACGMAFLAATLFWQPCDPDDNVRAQIASFHSIGFDGTDEYTPRGAANDEILTGIPPVRVLRSVDGEEEAPAGEDQWTPMARDEIPATVRVQTWGGERRSAIITSPQAGFAVLRLMAYPAWRVTVNGAPQPPIHRRDGLMVIPLAAGESRIDVRWFATRDEWAGRWISLAALAITLTLIGKGRRTNRGENFR